MYTGCGSCFPELCRRSHIAGYAPRHSPKHFLEGVRMATMSELNAEYYILKATHERLIEERAALNTSDAGGTA